MKRSPNRGRGATTSASNSRQPVFQRSHSLRTHWGFHLRAYIRTILLVEDHVDIRELVKRYLKMARYPVATASDGAEGFRFYEEHQSGIGLRLTDVTMPNHLGARGPVHLIPLLGPLLQQYAISVWTLVADEIPVIEYSKFLRRIEADGCHPGIYVRLV
jgi:CheY-like chemotaxis protein